MTAPGAAVPGWIGPAAFAGLALLAALLFVGVALLCRSEESRALAGRVALLEEMILDLSDKLDPPGGSPQ